MLFLPTGILFLEPLEQSLPLGCCLIYWKGRDPPQAVKLFLRLPFPSDSEHKSHQSPDLLRPQTGEALCPRTLLFFSPRPVSALIWGEPTASWKETCWQEHLCSVHLGWPSPPARLTSPSPSPHPAPGVAEGKVPTAGSWHFPMGFPRLTNSLFHTPFGSQPGTCSDQSPFLFSVVVFSRPPMRLLSLYLSP